MMKLLKGRMPADRRLNWNRLHEMEDYMYLAIHFLTPAEDFEDAISRVEDNLDYGRDFYDNYEVLRGDSGSLDEKLDALSALLNGKGAIARAESYLAKAEESKAASDFITAGYCYRCAGALYGGSLTDDMPLYNIHSRDYQIPLDTRGWFSIAVKFSP
jgi:hypothetical protein